MAREWDVPKRDLLDIERTAQADKVAAADHLADVALSALGTLKNATLFGHSLYAADITAELERAVNAYRAASGDEATDWTPEDILRNEG